MEQLELLDSKIETAKVLIGQLKNLISIDGILKLQRKVIKELQFLEKKRNSNNIQDVVKCTNLTHFSAVVNILYQLKEITYVDHSFTMKEKKVGIDIVCDGGLTWVKVIARNAQSLNRVLTGDCNYGVRTIIDHAVDIIECANEYPCYYKTPKVIFYFMNDIDPQLKQDLENLSIIVRISSKEISHSNKINLFPSSESSIQILKSSVEFLNLDVSTMIAYVSNLTNGEANWVFKEPLLTDQAERELKEPVKPVLDNIFKDKKLICCETAHTSFLTILSVVGGLNEQSRGYELLNRIAVLPDNAMSFINNEATISQHQNLKIGGKIKARSNIVFEFGHQLKAATLSANDGFVRAAKQQGIYFVAFIHESRALTELKQNSATRKD